MILLRADYEKKEIQINCPVCNELKIIKVSVNLLGVILEDMTPDSDCTHVSFRFVNDVFSLYLEGFKK